MPARKTFPIQNIVQPVMQLRARLDRITTLALREKMGFGISQFRILYVLAYKPYLGQQKKEKQKPAEEKTAMLSQKNIADFWDVTEASVSRQISILRRKGLIQKKPSTLLTPKGMAVLREGLHYMATVFETVFKNIPEEHRKKAAKILESLSNEARWYLEKVEK